MPRTSSSPSRCRSAALGPNELIEATPLAENGFLYITNSWGVLYKIDATSGDAAASSGGWTRSRRSRAQPRRRVLGQSCDLAGQLAGARHRHRQGQRQGGVGDQHYGRPGRTRLTAAPLALRTRSSSAPPAATAACATGSPASMPPPAACCGENSPFRRRASRAPRPGRATPMPGRPAAARCGLPAPTIRRATRPSGAPATRSRCSTRSTGPATTSTPTARSPGTPKPAR